MTLRDRKTLRDYFKDGALPTGSNFSDLIESSLNLNDDGFSRSAQNGVEITLVGNYRRLLSFFVSESQRDRPSWSITCDPQDAMLSFVRVGDSASAAGTSSGAATVNGNGASPSRGAQGADTDREVMNLDSDGTVRVHGALQSYARIGISGSIPADGAWHDITEVLSGCQMFEVVAGVGLPGENKGRYALLHAVAANSFNPRKYFFNFLSNKKPIRCSHAWYLDRADRMKLRWVNKEDSAGKHDYALQLKTMRKYERDTEVRFTITRLWLDDMASGT